MTHPSLTHSWPRGSGLRISGELIVPINRPCRLCGVLIERGTRNQKYCCPAHQARAAHERTKARKRRKETK